LRAAALRGVAGGRLRAATVRGVAGGRPPRQHRGWWRGTGTRRQGKESCMNRVVTGYDANGAAAVLWHGDPPTVIHAGRYTTTELWVSDRGPLAATGADNSAREWGLEPPPGGACFRIVEIAPHSPA